MNILFLTISGMPNYERHDIYADILHEFVRCGHTVCAVSANQRRNGRPTELKEEYGIHALRVRTGNITQCGMVEKGISTLLVKHQFISAIKRYFSSIKFDLVLYATPPITVAGVVEFVKKRDGAKSYLMLKDIFPQNAVDLCMLSQNGLRGIMYRYFRREERRLYAVSDRIGCMSPANVRYILEHNQEVKKEDVEIFPNCLSPLDLRINSQQRELIRKKYGIPLHKKVFVYGGNLGKPQGIPFLIEALQKSSDIEDAFFLIVGGGTEYKSLETFINCGRYENIMLLNTIPKDDYDILVACCDVGLIFLDHRFTIPNFPSRLLSYLQAGLPIIAATDSATDIGAIAVENGFGWSCESNNASDFRKMVTKAINADLGDMGQTGYVFLLDHYDISVGYAKLEEFINRK